MQDHSPEFADSLSYQCPSCGQTLTAPVGAENLLQCPNCGEQFFIQSASESEPQTTEEPPGSTAPDSEISDLRIRAVMHARQAMYRSRRWPIVFAAASLMAAAKFIQIAVVAFGHGQKLTPIADLFTAVLALLLAVHFCREVVRITHQIRATRQPEPLTAPDFSTLSDGSQRWKNLEKLTDTEP